VTDVEAAPTKATDATVDPDIVLMPHTHWDREWYEPHDVFRLRLVHVLDDLIARLEADDDFRFTLDGQSAAIEDYLELRPENRRRVEALVRAGRLAVGPFLILLDEFCCDGETIVRNLELGISSARRLGKVMDIGYLPDMFGHTAQMPQILRGFGIEHAALWRGVPAAVQTHAFTWSAPDGSVVRCEYLFDGYGSALDMLAVPGRLTELAGKYRTQTRSWYGDDPVLGMYGTDHMSPPPDLMDRVRSHNSSAASSGGPSMSVATLQEYLDSRPTDPAALTGLPAVAGELRSHARGNLLPGVFSVRTNLKAAMASAELTLSRAERLDALYATDDHQAFFDLAWHRVVESSAHDSVTGCGVDATADQVEARLASAESIGRAIIERVSGDLARAVPSDAHLVINTLPWRRPVQAELVTPADPDGNVPDPDTQVLADLDTVLGDELMTSDDLVKVLRRIHGRELFGQQIVSYEWGPDTLRFDVAEVAEGVFDLAGLTAEIEALRTTPDARARTWRVQTVAHRSRRLIVEADVPPLGHVSLRPAEARSADFSDRAEASRTRLSNGMIEVELAPDGTLTLTGADGTVLSGVGRLVDEGDRGDSYNYGPTAGSAALDTPESIDVRVLAEGPLRGVVEVERTYRLPLGVDRARPDQRMGEFETLCTRMLVEVRRHEPFARLSLELVNTVRDHRLRMHIPLGKVVSHSYASGQFDVTRRGRTAEGGWGEFPLPTFPATGFVSAGNAHVLLTKLTEYEVVAPVADDSPGSDTVAGDELALTLMRAVGLMSVNVHPLRDEPAGSEIPVPGAQYLGRTVSTRLAVLPRSGGWEAADIPRWAEVFRHDPVVVRGTATAGTPLPAPVSGPVLDGPAVLTSLREVGGASGGGSSLEARLVNFRDEAAPASLSAPAGLRWMVTNLGGRPVDNPTAHLAGRSIRTLRTTT
jgi:mannosylglycerate hydrolase